MFTFVRHYMNFIFSKVLSILSLFCKIIAHRVCTDLTFSFECILQPTSDFSNFVFEKFNFSSDSSVPIKKKMH